MNPLSAESKQKALEIFRLQVQEHMPGLSNGLVVQCRANDIYLLAAKLRALLLPDNQVSSAREVNSSDVFQRNAPRSLNKSTELPASDLQVVLPTLVIFRQSSPSGLRVRLGRNPQKGFFVKAVTKSQPQGVGVPLEITPNIVSSVGGNRKVVKCRKVVK